MKPSTVCFGAKDDSYGSFTIPTSGNIITFKLKYLNGSVSCYKNNQDVNKSNWGCKRPDLGMGTYITDSTRNRLLPKEEYLNGHHCEYYSLPWAKTNSPELLFDNFSDPLRVETNQKFQVWFCEDFLDKSDCDESDNGDEKTCAEVYGLYA